MNLNIFKQTNKICWCETTFGRLNFKKWMEQSKKQCVQLKQVNLIYFCKIPVVIICEINKTMISRF